MTLRFKTTSEYKVNHFYHRSLFRPNVITWSALLQLQKGNIRIAQKTTPVGIL